jgi:signal transduction histidine kinase
VSGVEVTRDGIRLICSATSVSMHELSDDHRTKLQKAASLHWFHWVIVSLSLVVTLCAWYFTQNQVREKREQQFEREADSLQSQVEERMRKYEDALWAGVAVYDTYGESVTREQWRDYTRSIHIEVKYPGISGLGVIRSVAPDQIDEYIAREQESYPAFAPYPEHEEDEYLPITFIEPLAKNIEAVGLDMAHETNRFEAAKRTRRTGASQITGPIVLVQDAGSTPGFLFYAPFYANPEASTVEERLESFRGMVYAPFVVKDLMRGVLAEENRYVGVRISDGDEVLYDEHSPDVADFDRDPMIERTKTIAMYGRNWTFDIRAADSFRLAQSNSQPRTILIGGLVIDALLIGLFVLISRANRRALRYADSATAELKQQTKELKLSNQELERFAYVASHDLQEPLRMVRSFATLLGEEYEGKLDERGNRWLGFMVDGAVRMQALVKGLLEYSRIGRIQIEPVRVNTNAVFDRVLVDITNLIEETNADVTRQDLPDVIGVEQHVAHVFQNLIANAIKFHESGQKPIVEVGAEHRGALNVFFVRDNGIGIEAQYADRIFEVFQRLHTNEAFPGTGIGLAVVKKIIDAHGGEIWFESRLGEGSTFVFSFPQVNQSEAPGSLVHKNSDQPNRHVYQTN